ncbi:uncharacterized protein [Chelonus insularis]|uniref:uncharacterized protein n=1 Tax=Chelonus insularis TaxID=460826 RepID=UPI00158EDE34|nr:uncharacterized protein LOC118075075 [Chelonus insularis]XP_034952593.1 uncharacterized protein LOC118075075 [Chelonus insularis]
MEQNKYSDDKNKKLTKVRRKLFVDEEDQNGKSQAADENLTNKFLEEIDMARKKMEEKWNFDFVNGRPLPGNWEYVRPHEDFKETDNKQETSNNNFMSM